MTEMFITVHECDRFDGRIENGRSHVVTIPTWRIVRIERWSPGIWWNLENGPVPEIMSIHLDNGHEYRTLHTREEIAEACGIEIVTAPCKMMDGDE